MSIPYKTVTRTVTIANGASLSGAMADTGGYTLVGVSTDAAWDTNAVSFQGSVDGTTYFNVYNNGTEVSIAGVVASTYNGVAATFAIHALAIFESKIREIRRRSQSKRRNRSNFVPDGNVIYADNTESNDPLVVRVLYEYRNRLDGKEAQLMEDMGRQWLLMERRLDADIAALAYEMERRRREGEIITEQIVWKSDRYKSLKAQMQAEITKYNRDYAVTAISNAQESYGLLGIEASNAAISASYATVSAIGPMWNKLNINAIQSMIGFAGDGSPLNNLLKKDFPDALNGLLQALIGGVTRGLGPEAIAREMSSGMGMGFNSALTIARTESARAYRTGSTEQYRQSGVCSGFRRLVKKATACMACLMLDGQRFTLESELEDHPQGLCVAICDIKGVPPVQWQTGKEYFMTLSPEEQAARMGAEKYALWKETNFPLENFAKMSHSDVWGDAPRVANLSELTG